VIVSLRNVIKAVMIMASAVSVQKKTDRLKGWEAGRFESVKGSRLSGLPASSFDDELSAIRYKLFA
jgi:hypothetical protein